MSRADSLVAKVCEKCGVYLYLVHTATSIFSSPTFDFFQLLPVLSCTNEESALMWSTSSTLLRCMAMHKINT